MSDEVKAKKPRSETRQKAVVNLNKEVAAKVTIWMGQAQDQLKGIHVGQAQLVNWVLNRIPNDLPSDELKALKAEFHDDVVYARWFYLETLRRRKAGESTKAGDVTEAGMSPSSIKRKTKTRIKSSVTTSNAGEVTENGIEKESSSSDSAPDEVISSNGVDFDGQ